VTETDINSDLAASNPAQGLIVIVTVITEAAHNADGSAHFQTFVDVTGDAEPTPTQRHDICRGIANSLSRHLQMDASGIKCELNPRATNGVKRVTSSYVADLTVGQQSSGAFLVAASIALTATAVLASI
jgi:hypothetical protein